MALRSLLALGLCAACLALAGCASGPPSPPAGGAAGAAHGGVYKVGSPYQINGVWYYPAEDWSYEETGIASWYGEAFHGKYTANGEVFDLNALTAAHRTLPMPSIVEVTNLDNGRLLRLRVNDRGPYARNRIIDVSRRAAQLLGFEGIGTAKVRVKFLVPESIQAASLAGRNGGDAELAGAAPPAVPVAKVATEPLPPPGTKVASAQPQLAMPTPAAPPPAAVTGPLLPDKVTTVAVKRSQIYIQAGAFARVDNAVRLKTLLDRLGNVKVTSVRANGIDLYRVRIGPVNTVDEADALLNRVAGTAPEAKIVVD